MTSDYSKYEEAAIIRSHYNEAVQEAYKLYYESEEVAAYLALEVFRLENLSCASESEENERLERIIEKQEVLSRTKETMHFILDKLHALARDRDKFVSDIYTSSKIVDLESKLSDLTPWLQDLLVEVQSRAETAKLNAKITSEIGKAKDYYR
jgi:hypothetical protein